MASPKGAELSCCALTIDPATGSTTVTVPGLTLAELCTATYSFCWLGFQLRSLPERFRTVRFTARGLMLKIKLPDVPPPGVGFCTATLALPTEPRFDAGIWAVKE